MYLIWLFCLCIRVLFVVFDCCFRFVGLRCFGVGDWLFGFLMVLVVYVFPVCFLICLECLIACSVLFGLFVLRCFALVCVGLCWWLWVLLVSWGKTVYLCL